MNEQCTTSSRQTHRETAAAKGLHARAWSIAASLLLHALLALALMVPLTVEKHVSPLQEGIPVEVWAPEQFEALIGHRGADGPAQDVPARSSALEVSPAPDADATSPAKAPATQAASVVHAETILSGAVLADPRNRVQQKLARMDEGTRLEQLCGIEAIAQIAEWRKEFHPDRIVAYAMADLKVKGDLIVADGAAFHSDNAWHKLAFKCELQADHQTVKAFEFSVGAPIPRRSWERYGLPDERELD